MASVSDEVELKYDVAPDVDVAEVLRGAVVHLGGVQLRAEVEVRRHEATYLDTHDLRLQAGRLTLRRRTGGPDAGWHLKVPGGEGARVEVRVPLGRSASTVPPTLRSLVQVRARGAELVPVAEIATERVVSLLVDDEGTVLAEVADDRVTARRPGEEDPAPWRELEVELVEGARDLLADLDPVLRAAGLAPAAAASKLARVLHGDTGLRQPDPLSPHSPAGEVVLAYLTTQVEQLRTQDPLVRLDRPDSVHKMRVATRRLRSGLQTFAPLLEPASTQPLLRELRWLAGQLGSARDAEVMRDRLRAALPDDRRHEGVERLAETYRRAHDAVLVDLDSSRYDRLLDALEELLTDGCLRPAARRPAQEVLPPRVRRVFRALRAEMATADAAADEEAQAHHLHEARKAAKRARYAGEALSEAFGDDAAVFAAEMERLQEVLGEHQDSIVMREHLLELAADADARDAFVYGRLHAQEEARGDVAREEASVVWQEASAKRLRHWLRRRD